MASLPYAAEVGACGALEDSQSETAYGGIDVVEDIGCDMLMLDPDGRPGEEIQLHRESRLCRSQLTHH